MSLWRIKFQVENYNQKNGWVVFTKGDLKKVTG